MSIPRASAVALRRFAAFLCAGCSMMIVDCSRETEPIGAVKRHFENREYREAIFLCAGALENRRESGEIRFYYGLSLLAVGRDFEAFPQLERAAALEPSLAPLLSERLAEAGRFDVREGRTARASSRLMEAAKLDTALALGRFAYLVADEHYRNKNYRNAARFYEDALSAQSDTGIAEQSMMRLADSYARLDSLDPAEDVYEEIIKRYPRGEYAGDARWNLANLFLGRAREQLALGNFEEALDAAEAAADIADDIALIRQARFLMGEACEGRAEYEAAFEHYEAVVKSGRGASGGVVQKARNKIESFRRAGLYD